MINPRTTVRQAVPEDADKLVELYNSRTSADVAVFSPRELINRDGSVRYTTDTKLTSLLMLNTTGERYDVVAERDRIVAGWGFLNRFKDGQCWLGVYTSGAYRSQGIATAIIVELQRHAVAQGYVICLRVITSNAKAIQRYKATGFVEDGVQYQGRDGNRYQNMVWRPLSPAPASSGDVEL